jgi:hypothetical protein
MSSPKQATNRHLALHATQLGVARWRQGPDRTAHPAMPQAAWHAAAQQRFMDWLAAGGFDQAEHGERQDVREELKA